VKPTFSGRFYFYTSIKGRRNKMKKTLISILFILAAIAAVLIPALPVGAQVIPPDPKTEVFIDASVKSGAPPYLTALTVKETNTGNVVLTDVSVIVSGGWSGTLTSTAAVDYPGTVFTGDNGNNKLDVGETWQWVVPDVSVTASTSFTATGHGIFTQITKAGKITKDITAPEFPLEQLSVDVQAQEIASLGDFVWRDCDKDGIQDAGEPGVAGVRVDLLDGSGNPILDYSFNPDGEPVYTTTDANGYYLFAGLAPGAYSVKFTLPTGFVFTTKNAPGSNAANDSDADTGTGKTVATTLVNREEDLTWDAGIYQKLDLKIVKTDGVCKVYPGEPITYTLTVTNNGPGNAVGATVTDTIPTTLLNVTWTSSTTGSAAVTAGASGSGNNLSATINIAAGAGNSVVFSVHGTVSPTALSYAALRTVFTGSDFLCCEPPPPKLTNTAVVTAPPCAQDTNLNNNTSTDTDDIVAAPAVITKAASSVYKYSAILNGSVTSKGPYTSVQVYFEYGQTISYGTTTTPTTKTSTGNFSRSISGLSKGTTYHYRAVLLTPDGALFYGADTTFTTRNY
jgi:uncharacterized repeat protein (TIGR01451 family)